MKGGRNSMGLIAGILLLLGLFLPWYEMSGLMNNAEIMWRVYPFWQEYNENTRSLVLSVNLNNLLSASRLLILQPIAAIIAIFSSSIKNWGRRTVCFTIATVMILICIGDSVQEWNRKTSLNGLPVPSEEIIYDNASLRGQWGIGFLISVIGTFFMLLSVWIEVWRLITMLGKEAAESIAKRWQLSLTYSLYFSGTIKSTIFKLYNRK
ncbi:MAG: hypothetical protein ACUVQ0_01750 [Thermoproteota archaeon]